MATLMMAVTRTTSPDFQWVADVHVKANSPYGLPIVDNCVRCPLRTSNSFCALSPDSIELLDEMKQSTSYPEGALVFTEGQTARGVYILCQGRAKVLATNSDGKTLIVKIAQPGEILGVHSAVSGAPHEFTVETLQPSQLAFVRRVTSCASSNKTATPACRLRRTSAATANRLTK
jgi:CRP-like cAMP-binding protein